MENMVQPGARTYGKFALMIAASFIIMYAVMFFNVDRLSHIYLSYTRLYMSLLMVTPMAVLMLLLMPKMYPDRRKNAAIVIASTAVFVFALTGLRSQAFIGDREYMKAMIPHHSSAIMTSKNANIRDPEVRRLADSIIASQQREIGEMKKLLERLDK